MVIEQDGLVFRIGAKVPIAPRPVCQAFHHGLISRIAWPIFATFWILMTLGLGADMMRSGETWGLLMPGFFLLIGG